MLRAFAKSVLILLTGFLSAGFPDTVCAQVKEFPYEATIAAEEAFVRSGPNDSFYPTQKLSRDTTVTVHRHDPGGWYMIDPPEGSFSWIPERFVRRLSDSEGEVTSDTIAFVGSEFGDEVSVFQRRLKVGEKITILGQRDIDTESGMQSMLRVKPPVREWRWIPGSAVVPLDPQKRQQANTDPYAVPGNAKRPDGAIVTPTQNLNSKSVAGVTNVPEVGPSSQLARLQLIRSEQQKLAEIDRRFREMILQDSSHWNLDGIESDYRVLQENATYKPVSGQIDLRYPAIERYRRRLAQLQDLKQVTSRTESQDAALLARNPSYANRSGLQVASIESTGPENVPVAGQAPQLAQTFAEFVSQNSSSVANGNSGASEVVAETSPASNEVAITPSSPQNRFVGAGIVQRADEEGHASGFVLITPAGRVLADLKPAGSVRLEEFVGQKVGVQGSRWSEQDKRDIIEVSALEPVRIRQ